VAAVCPSLDEPGGFGVAHGLLKLVGVEARIDARI
jgi:hypothetical protein